MTRFKDYEKVIKFPVFADYRVHVIVTDDLQKSRDARFDNAQSTEGLDACCCSVLNGHASCIFLQKEASSGTIAHEAWHAVYKMFRQIGAELEEEMVAYHLGYLVDEIMAFVWHDDIIDPLPSSPQV